MAEPQQETWLKLVALTVIVLAAAAGVAAFKASAYAVRVQIAAAREARQWQDYQVTSVKKENLSTNRDFVAFVKLSEGKAAKGPKTLAGKIKELDEEMTRLNQERDQIKKVALELAAQQETLAKKAGELGLAVMLLQIAIMAAGTGALTRKKILWLAGLALGAWGLVNLGKGLFL